MLQGLETFAHADNTLQKNGVTVSFIRHLEPATGTRGY